MNYNSILVDIQDQIATITINRPKALNAINREVMSELNNWFSDNKDDFNIRGVVITGSGFKAFAAGADIKEFAELSEAETVKMSSFGHETYLKIENFHAPVIAAVNGFALGGGCELAMACHMIVASENAKFGQPEANLGLSPGYGGTQRLTALVGRANALELLFMANIIDAKEAFRIGLINKMVPDGEALNYTLAILNKIKTKAPIATKENIQLVNSFVRNEGYNLEAKAFGRLMVTDDAKEGALAFVEKRKASFLGK